MSDNWDRDRIHAFWTERVLSHGASPDVSWSDRWAIDLEIRTIGAYLADGDRVLDVGCATGWSTVQWAAEHRLFARGLDYVPEMIEGACQTAADMQDHLRGEVEFDVGDITALSEPDDEWTKVVVTRVVINLGDWETQERALSECARVLAPGGLLLLSEATIQGWEQLNRLRAEWDLPAIGMPPFNTYLDAHRVIEALEPSLELIELRDFASTYYVGTRVLKPLLAKALDSEVDAADPLMEWNRWFSHLPAAGDYGTQKLFVFRKAS